MKVKTKLKLIIPNFFSILRILIGIVIMILGIKHYHKLSLVFILFGIFTDIMDGALAKKWYTTTNKGHDLDILCDEIFLIGIIGSFAIKYKLFIIILVLEVIKDLIILIIYKKKQEFVNLRINLFLHYLIILNIVIAFITLFKSTVIINGSTLLIINLEIITIINYINYYFISIKNCLSINNYEAHRKIMEETSEEFEKTKAITDLKEIVDEYENKNDIY